MKDRKKVGLDGLVITELFFRRYQPGVKCIDFVRDDYEWALSEVKKNHSNLFLKNTSEDQETLIPNGAEGSISKHKNIGAVIYDFRFRRKMPAKIRETEQPEKERYWRISLAGKGKYRFVLGTNPVLVPEPTTKIVEIFEATPEIITEYCLDDEQALLAKVRYNRLVDTFLGVTAHSLQNHLRTFVEDVGQIEIDELYVGYDRSGRRFVIPVQAKGKKDKLSLVQTEQDLAFCRAHKDYRLITPRAVSAQFLPDGSIHLFEMGTLNGEVRAIKQRRYCLRRASKTIESVKRALQGAIK